MGRPVLFRQQRAGLNERPFFIYKFRTMSETRDASGNLLPDEERITPLGRILRSTSLDELPQLFNVLRGDMSMLGPRPLPVAYLDRYTPEQTRRHEVMPGMTGWAQVNGRNAISWEKKFELAGPENPVHDRNQGCQTGRNPCGRMRDHAGIPGNRMHPEHPRRSCPMPCGS
jgi:lipopolysaccharide/colanic/teichoic acid biosynthesis glycosyltransferase